jgi:hypothetical protein
MTWLRESEWARGRPIGLVGTSRGAEQALLVASILEGTSLLAAVSVHASTSLVWGSWDPSRVARGSPRSLTVSAWTYDGKPLRAGMPIAIERYAGPIFMSHGTKDMIWPSRYTEESPSDSPAEPESQEQRRRPLGRREDFGSGLRIQTSDSDWVQIQSGRQVIV